MQPAHSPQLDLLEAVLKVERTKRKLTVVLPLEGRLRRQAMRTWKQQGKRVLITLARFAGDFPELQEAVDPTDISTALGRAVVTDPALSNAIQVVSEQALLGGADSAQLDLSVDASFSLANPRAVSWLARYGAERVAGIDDVTRGYLRTIVTNAADEGWSYQRTAAAITERFTQFAVGIPQEAIRSRAELVAVTEVGEAYEQGAKIVAQGFISQGLQIEKGWLAEDDACEECAQNEADGFIDEAATFSSGDDAPLVHPGCRCDVERKVVEPDEEA